MSGRDESWWNFEDSTRRKRCSLLAIQGSQYWTHHRVMHWACSGSYGNQVCLEYDMHYQMTHLPADVRVAKTYMVQAKRTTIWRKLPLKPGRTFCISAKHGVGRLRRTLSGKVRQKRRVERKVLLWTHMRWNTPCNALYLSTILEGEQGRWTHCTIYWSRIS